MNKHHSPDGATIGYVRLGSPICSGIIIHCTFSSSYSRYLACDYSKRSFKAICAIFKNANYFKQSYTGKLLYTNKKSYMEHGLSYSALSAYITADSMSNCIEESRLVKNVHKLRVWNASFFVHVLRPIINMITQKSSEPESHVAGATFFFHVHTHHTQTNACTKRGRITWPVRRHQRVRPFTTEMYQISAPRREKYWRQDGRQARAEQRNEWIHLAMRAIRLVSIPWAAEPWRSDVDVQ